ncbi:PF20097 family protein [Clostridium senegalense]
MKCPYCNEPLIRGFIHSGRHSFKWHNDNAGLKEKFTVFGGEVLSNNTMVKCFRCIKCGKIIIDLYDCKL